MIMGIILKGVKVTMRRVTSLLIAVLLGGGILLISSCATVPTGPLAPGEVKLLRIEVPHEGSIKGNLPFAVNITFEADGKPEIRTACFYWSGDGPKCFKVLDVSYGSPGTINVEPRAMSSGSYVLETYVLYIRDGKTQPTKRISSPIFIP
jgi:hypothetical protein